MVSTRNHPQAFPSASPSKISQDSSAETTFNSKDVYGGEGVWSHTPSNLSLIWLVISLPLVIWDTAYVFLRPHSMAGGKLQWPLWMPYELYATVDYVYGWPSYDRRDGFTAAQASLNVVETIGYLGYLYIIYSQGNQTTTRGRGAPSKKQIGWLGQTRAVHGRWAAYAVLILESVSLMTLSKTILYWLNEAFSGFANIGHNSFADLVVLWVIPNGAWIVIPAYMLYVSSAEILEGLEMAAAGNKKMQ